MTSKEMLSKIARKHSLATKYARENLTEQELFELNELANYLQTIDVVGFLLGIIYDSEIR